MKLILDTEAQTLTCEESDRRQVYGLYTPEAFGLLSRQWVKCGWATKYSYNFSWMGRPIIQLPEDLIAVQEVISEVKPDVIIETGVAHGGSGVFYASLFEAYGHGRVISIDIEIRPHNRAAIEAHPLKKRITLIEGSSTSSKTIEQVRGLLRPGEKIMVVLDSNHTKAHVLQELALYGPMVSSGSYIVVTDGVMEDLHNVPGGQPDWIGNNPRAALHEFLQSHPEFEINRKPTQLGITYWPDAYLRRK
jgi:cephalosporin hydroxylase